MAVLLLRLAAPLQAWGDESKFETRRTLPYPTKSGIIGLISAALGNKREMPIEAELLGLRLGIRVDLEGTLVRDYHTVTGKKPYITNRDYLCDATFLVGLESDDMALLTKVERAIKSPVYPLYLGRRSCPPDIPIIIGIKDKDLETALYEEPWLIAEWRQKKASNLERQLRIVVEDNSSDTMIKDVPLSFSKKYRRFGLRGIRECGYVYMTDEYLNQTVHDPFVELG